MTTDNAPTVLSRYAKAIAAVVEAGGPEQKYHIYLDEDSTDEERDYAAIAVLEKYVREDVVVWYQNREGRHSRLPTLIGTGRWTWAVGRKGKPDIVGGDECPTEAYIAFLEAIASVVAGEKGEVSK